MSFAVAVAATMEAGPQTVGGVLATARRRLAGIDSPPLDFPPLEPGLDASLLLAHVLGLPRTALIARPERPVGPDERGRFGKLVARRAAGEPLSWLTGRREFWSLELEVDRSTLVPRPETERLVESVLAAMEEMEGGRCIRVADLGTGCGAVAIAIAREAAAAEVVATEIDPEALAVARRNARRLAPGRIELRLGSWCDPLESAAYSIIASNPPYLREDDPHLQGDGIRREPRQALVAGSDGLEAIRRICAGAGRCLRPGGRLLVEHGADQGAAVRGILRGAGFEWSRTHRDLGGRERVTEGTKP